MMTALSFPVLALALVVFGLTIYLTTVILFPEKF